MRNATATLCHFTAEMLFCVQLAAFARTSAVKSGAADSQTTHIDPQSPCSRLTDGHSRRPRSPACPLSRVLRQPEPHTTRRAASADPNLPIRTSQPAPTSRPAPTSQPRRAQPARAAPSARGASRMAPPTQSPPQAQPRTSARRSEAAMAAAAAPGSAAPVIGRPITSRSAPARRASSGVATRA
jgi:hypothetical protein